MGEEQVIVPAEEVDKAIAPTEEVDKALEEAPAEEVDKAAEGVPEEMAPEPTPLSWEKREELRRNLDASKREALRLKQEKEQLEAQLRQLEAQKAAGVTQDDIAVFKHIARQAGVPLAEDVEAQRFQLYEQERDAQLQSFLEKYPEYNQPGTPESDARWSALEAEISQFVAPQDPKQWATILNKAHKMLTTDDGTAIERGKALGMAQAKVSEQRTAGGGTGAGASKKTTTQPTNPDKEAVKALFKQARPQYFQEK